MDKAFHAGLRLVALAFLALAGLTLMLSSKSSDPMMTALTAALVVVGLLQWFLIEGQDKHFTNSERAWLLADLGWCRRAGHIIESKSQVNGLDIEGTHLDIRINLKNEGRSPAWIDKVSARMEIMSDLRNSHTLANAPLKNYGTSEPLGASKDGSHDLDLECGGQRGQSNYLIVYAVVDYHDIFNIARQTTVGYCVNHEGHLRRLVEFPKLNQNT